VWKSTGLLTAHNGRSTRRDDGKDHMFVDHMYIMCWDVALFSRRDDDKKDPIELEKKKLRKRSKSRKMCGD